MLTQEANVCEEQICTQLRRLAGTARSAELRRGEHPPAPRQPTCVASLLGNILLVCALCCGIGTLHHLLRGTMVIVSNNSAFLLSEQAMAAWPPSSTLTVTQAIDAVALVAVVVAADASSSPTKDTEDVRAALSVSDGASLVVCNNSVLLAPPRSASEPFARWLVTGGVSAVAVVVASAVSASAASAPAAIVTIGGTDLGRGEALLALEGNTVTVTEGLSLSCEAIISVAASSEVVRSVVSAVFFAVNADAAGKADAAEGRAMAIVSSHGPRSLLSLRHNIVTVSGGATVSSTNACNASVAAATMQVFARQRAGSTSVSSSSTDTPSAAHAHVAASRGGKIILTSNVVSVTDAATVLLTTTTSPAGALHTAVRAAALLVQSAWWPPSAGLPKEATPYLRMAPRALLTADGNGSAVVLKSNTVVVRGGGNVTTAFVTGAGVVCAYGSATAAAVLARVAHVPFSSSVASLHLIPVAAIAASNGTAEVTFVGNSVTVLGNGAVAMRANTMWLNGKDTTNSAACGLLVIVGAHGSTAARSAVSANGTGAAVRFFANAVVAEGPNAKVAMSVVNGANLDGAAQVAMCGALVRLSATGQLSVHAIEAVGDGARVLLEQNTANAAARYILLFNRLQSTVQHFRFRGRSAAAARRVRRKLAQRHWQRGSRGSRMH